MGDILSDEILEISFDGFDVPKKLYRIQKPDVTSMYNTIASARDEDSTDPETARTR